MLLWFSTLVVLVSMYLYVRSCRSKNPVALPTNWPILYMFPSLMVKFHNLRDYFTTVLARSGHNLWARGPPGTGMRFFVTCDPANVRHIYTANYTNYPKGAEVAAIFDMMAGSLFTIDGETADMMHARAQKIISSQRFSGRVAACVHEKVEKGLVPFLADMASTATTFDMQELMLRCMLDLTTLMVFGIDPGLLSTNMPPMDVSDAMDTVMEVGFIRNAIPVSCWKAMRWLNIGPERKLHAAHKVIQGFIEEMTERWKINKGRAVNDQEDDMMSACINHPLFADPGVLPATLISLMLAGRDTVGTTLPWVFYNLAQNPDAVSTIRNELSPVASRKIVGERYGAAVIFEPDEIKSMTYLRAALYETLRLYPSAPMERKTVAFNDIMPSGHEVNAGDTIFISLYSMGRMNEIWGKHCLEYNPDRWLSQDHKKLRYVPSHKFMAFNSGPRICPGKEIGVMQMKTIVASVMWNFDMEMVDGKSIQHKMSCILQMKNGLTMKVHKRQM